MSCVELIFFFFVLHTGSYSSFNLKEMVMPGQFYLFLILASNWTVKAFVAKLFSCHYMMVPEWWNDEGGEMQGNIKMYVFKYKHLNYL